MIRARVTYGGLSGEEGENDWSPKHRTRQKKINYTEMPNTESEDVSMFSPLKREAPGFVFWLTITTFLIDGNTYFLMIGIPYDAVQPMGIGVSLAA